MRHSWKQEKAPQKQTQKTRTNNTKQTSQTTANSNTHIHVLLFCVLLWLLCSLLTYTGSCGIVGNKKTAKQTEHRNMKKNNTNQTHITNNNKQQQTHTCFCLLCVLLCLLFSLLTCKGTCGMVGNKKTQNKTNTDT